MSKGAVCIFERPTGDPIWRHSELLNNTAEVRPNNELVVRMAPVVGNYDYLVDYVFDRAGNIDVRLGAYGIDATKGVASRTLSDPTAKQDTAYGTLVDERLLAVNHDHYMTFRIDMDVDGTSNRLVEDRFSVRRLDEGQRKSLWQVETKPVATEGPVTLPLNAAQFRDREHGQDQQAGLSHQLSADARPLRRLAARQGRSDPATRRLQRLHAVDLGLRQGRALRRGPVPRPKILTSMACRNGPRRSGRSRIVTSCCGTRWASATCRAPRTGP